ncbi:MAG: hypothetical protein M1820_006024 [Bogoriella megaspora]|nr:MAG: hypothetical protein M1820_006024 [Bogoriella megaspora]
MTKVFVLGATGHIGGGILDAISNQLSGIEIVALVRDHGKARRLQQKYKMVRTILGDFNNASTIEEEAETAGIVINAAPDLQPGGLVAVKACLQGLASRPSRGFYIQTSGAFLIGEDTNGEGPSQKIWNDIADIDQLTALSPEHYHQATDKLVRDYSSKVNVAIVAPTVVYGLNLSTENRAPITTRDILATIKELGTGFTIGKGRNVLGYVHVKDLANIYIKLLADAANGAQQPGRQLWGQYAYYFANSEELTFAEYMRALVENLKEAGAITTLEVKEIGTESSVVEREIVRKTSIKHGYGANCRCQSERAKASLGWTPREPAVKATLVDVVNHLLYE